MKYGERLSSHTRPEWRGKCINYEALKAILDAGPKKPEAEFDEKARRFFPKCFVELEKVDKFYTSKVVEYDGRCKALEVYTRSLYLGTPSRPAEVTTPTPTPIDEPVQNRKQSQTLWKRFSTVVQRRFGFSTTKPTSTEKNDRQLESKEHFPPEAEEKFKGAAEEFYYELQCLKQFREENVTGFRKILKKYDKTRSSKRGEQWFQDKVQKTRFASSIEIDRLCERVEDFRIKLEHGDRKTAMEKLRVPTLSERRSLWTAFSSGFSTAAFVAIFSTSIVIAAYGPALFQPPWVFARLYRGTFLLLVSATLAAVNMWHWQRHGINYVLIMELDPRRHVTSENLFAAVTCFWSIWALGVVGYVASPWLKLPRLVFPLVSTIAFLLMLINPFDCILRESRFWLLRRVGRCLAAPFVNGSFFDFWLADQSSTLAPFFQDAYYFICFYATEVAYVDGWMSLKVKNTDSNTTSSLDFVYDNSTFGVDFQSGKDFCTSDAHGLRPIVATFPTLIRLFQCVRRFWFAKQLFPHFYNSGKYAVRLPIVLFRYLYRLDRKRVRGANNTYFNLWILSLGVSFGYSYFWDVSIDWRLLHTSRNKWLRTKLAYESIWPYYAAIVWNAVTRLMWTVQVSLLSTRVDAELVSSVLAIVEVLRRCVWNAFRLENEHVNNVEGLRVSRKMYAAPFKKHFGDFGKLVNRAKNGGVDGDGKTPTKKMETPLLVSMDTTPTNSTLNANKVQPPVIETK